MGIFSFFKKKEKKEIEKEIKISEEEERLLSDLQKVITLLKRVNEYKGLPKQGLFDSLGKAKGLLEHTRDEIKLIENIAKKQKVFGWKWKNLSIGAFGHTD